MSPHQENHSSPSLESTIMQHPPHASTAQEKGNQEIPHTFKGKDIIAQYLAQLDHKPGVYRMLNDKQKVLYVGKAKNLKKRVTTYTKPHRLPLRLQRMISETHSMTFFVTATEEEALLLEANLIKEMKPKYNVLLRDDKEFPQILIKTSHDFPQITKHRGKKVEKGIYFGPFSSIYAVNKTISSLTKIFLLRSCTDENFKTRKRPCLQYQIKRCSAPCVGLISQEEYAKSVRQAEDFFKGNSATNLMTTLSQEMESASHKLDFEKAALLRDQIKALSKIQSHQLINLPTLQNADVISLAKGKDLACIQVMFIRGGRLCGNTPFFIKEKDVHDASLLTAFMMQFYLNRDVPPKLLCHTLPFNHELIAKTLKTSILSPQRGAPRDLIKRATENAHYALQSYGMDQTDQGLTLFQEFLKLPTPIKRMEVYDNSHTGGQDSCGAMIVVNENGFDKKSYRKWYIKNTSSQRPSPPPAHPAPFPTSLHTIINQDDYAMMREVLTRRFQGSVAHEKDAILPDIILIDGGKGQLSIAKEVLQSLHLEHKVMAIAIAKGPKRNAGQEVLHFTNQDPVQLDPKSPLIHFLQQARDEAHRFVIQTHRKRRSKSRLHSTLDDIPGLGPKRKKLLLNHFGSPRAILEAAPEDIIKVPGISQKLAQTIIQSLSRSS